MTEDKKAAHGPGREARRAGRAADHRSPGPAEREDAAPGARPGTPRGRKGRPGWVIWFVGLPGSGKTTYARAVYRTLRDRGTDVEYLSMDERRKAYVRAPGRREAGPAGARAGAPAYTEEERLRAYRLFAEEAARAARAGRNVVMDGTAHRLSMRDYMRRLVPRFAEVYVRCSLETAMRRERGRPEGLAMAGLYEKAVQRKESGARFPGLGEVIGVDVGFEEDPGAPCVIDGDQDSIDQGRDRVLAFLAGWEQWAPPRRAPH